MYVSQAVSHVAPIAMVSVPPLIPPQAGREQQTTYDHWIYDFVPGTWIRACAR
jgi:hypothetical protein